MSLSEEAHLNILSLRRVLYTLFGFSVFFSFILLFLWQSWLGMDSIMEQYGSLQNLPTNLLIEIVEIYQERILQIIIFTAWVVILFVIYFFFHVQKKIKNLEKWDANYVKQSYFLVFQTTIPVGDTMGEKIYHLAKHVYPELRSEIALSDPSVLEKIEWHLRRFISYLFRRKRESEQERLSKALNYRTDSYILDLVLKTRHGFFIVKYFDNKTVGLTDLNELIKIVKKKFSPKMWMESKSSRVICVAREYDPEILLRVKDLVTSEINIDILVEEERGFSVLWIG